MPVVGEFSGDRAMSDVGTASGDVAIVDDGSNRRRSWYIQCSWLAQTAKSVTLSGSPGQQSCEGASWA